MGVAATFAAGHQTRGRHYLDHRRLLNGMLFRANTGIPWRDLPNRYGPWQTLGRSRGGWGTKLHWSPMVRGRRWQSSSAPGRRARRCPPNRYSMPCASIGHAVGDALFGQHQAGHDPPALAIAPIKHSLCNDQGDREDQQVVNKLCGHVFTQSGPEADVSQLDALSFARTIENGQPASVDTPVASTEKMISER